MVADAAAAGFISLGSIRDLTGAASTTSANPSGDAAYATLANLARELEDAGAGRDSDVTLPAPRVSYGGYSSATPRDGFKFLEFITDIGNWANIFTGGDAILFEYEMPLLELGLEFDATIATIPLPPPVSLLTVDVGAFGSLNLTADLTFGYDTYGIRQALESNNPWMALDGFYVSDNIKTYDSSLYPLNSAGKTTGLVSVAISIFTSFWSMRPSV